MPNAELRRIGLAQRMAPQRPPEARCRFCVLEGTRLTSISTSHFPARIAEDDATIAFAMSEERDPVVTQSVLQSELKILKSELTDLEKRLEKRISEEGATTRAHFDIMVEKVNDSVRLVAEVNAHHASILDNHESRLQKIEKR